MYPAEILVLNVTKMELLFQQESLMMIINCHVSMSSNFKSEFIASVKSVQCYNAP